MDTYLQEKQWDRDVKEVVDITTDIGLMLIFLTFVMARITPVLAKASNYYTSQEYQGTYAEALINATSTIMGIDNTINPWVSADIMNYGSGRIYIALNTQDNWKLIEPGEAYTFDVLGADKRISYLYYRSDSTTTVRITGRY
jgi:hypothetical protein